MFIPKTQFILFVVMSENNINMGIYQTFKQAYERVSSLVKGDDLIEIVDNYCGVTYSGKKGKGTYTISNCLFSYDKNLPLVEYSIKDEKHFSNLEESL